MTEPFQYRNPDGSLRLDEILGERCVRHYTRILASSSEEFAAMQLAIAPVDETPDTWGTWQEPPRETTADGLVVSAEGAVQRSGSSCQELALLPGIIWDVCGYYRRLGVGTRATVKQIRIAYLGKDPQQRSEPLFYAASQLLDPVIRRAYDLMPLGGLFMGDRSVRETIERKAAMEASRRNAEAWSEEDETDQAQVLKEWGFDKGVSDEEARERLSGDFRHGDASDELGSSLSRWGIHWGWFRLSEPYDGDPYHEDPDRWGEAAGDPGAVLEAWQAMVAAALEAAGIRMTFSVGVWPGYGVRSWHDSNQCCIFFIGRGHPTQQLATEAVKGYIVREKVRERLYMPILTEGAEAAEQISDEIKQSRSGFRIPQMIFKDGESFPLHFYTPHTRLLTFDVHSFIPTKAKPEGWPGDNYPDKMWAICANDRAFRLRDEAGNLTDGFEAGYGNCYIHTALAGVKDPKYGGDLSRPASQVYGLAVQREPIFDGPDGPVVGFRDVMVEYKAPDGVYQIPKFVYVSQKYGNFWHPIKATAYVKPNTILDKDFIIGRKEKEYSLSVAAHTPDCQPGTAAWAKYDEALALIGFDLPAFLLDHATPDHYARFFIPGVDPAGGYGRKKDDEDGDSSSQPAAEASAALPQVDPDVLANFRNSLSTRGTK
jgi:hypothetical protein